MKSYTVALHGILDGTLVSEHGFTPFQEYNLAIPMPLIRHEMSFKNN
jgi:hypothetical protein